MSHVHLVQLRVSRAEAARWRRAAVEEDRSIAALVRVAVREHLRRRDHGAERGGGDGGGET